VQNKKIEVVTRTKIERVDATVAEVFERLIADRHICPRRICTVALRIVHGGMISCSRQCLIVLLFCPKLAPLHRQ
jgi:acetate kinase